MLPLPARCPITGGEIVVTRFVSPESGVSFEGEFAVNAPFAQLTPEQLQFVETFVRCEGKFNRMESELGFSYPTLRGRLHEVIRALGYEPGKEEVAGVTEVNRRQVLDELNAGQLSFEEAMQILKGVGNGAAKANPGD